MKLKKRYVLGSVVLTALIGVCSNSAGDYRKKLATNPGDGLPKVAESVTTPSFNNTKFRQLVKDASNNTCGTITHTQRDREWSGSGLKYYVICDGETGTTKGKTHYYFSNIAGQEQVLPGI